MSELPLDQRMRDEIIQREWSGPWREIAFGWANEITAILIERDALRRQVEELLSEARYEPEQDSPF